MATSPDITYWCCFLLLVLFNGKTKGTLFQRILTYVISGSITVKQRKWNKVTDLKAKVNLHCQNFATLVKFNQNRSHRLFMSKTMESNRNGMMPYMCCIIFCAFHKHNSFPLGPKKAFISIYYLKSSMAELFHCVALFRDHPRPSISG